MTKLRAWLKVYQVESLDCIYLKPAQKRLPEGFAVANRIAIDIVSAQRHNRPFILEPSSAAARLGLRFERRVHTELKRFVPSIAASVEHNPVFTFCDAFGSAMCVPDFLLWCRNPERLIIVEVKLTYVPEALAKLKELYCPVVSEALKVRIVEPLVLVRNLTPAAPKPGLTVSEALAKPGRVLQWLNYGPIKWQ